MPLIAVRRLAAWSVLWLPALVQPALAETATPGCAVRSQSETVVVMVCPAPSVAEQWRVAAPAACGQRLRCNVWIWNDPALAPSTAPQTDDGLSKQQSSRAVAVWANDSKTLMLLRQRR